MIANKVSYHLDLRGPSIPIDTACSSSGVAIHMAVHAIRGGECEAAVVAGCQLNLRYVFLPCSGYRTNSRFQRERLRNLYSGLHSRSRWEVQAVRRWRKRFLS
jgi:acetyl-CoA acetyltransferase